MTPAETPSAPTGRERTAGGYLLDGCSAELERLVIQSETWERTGSQVLSGLEAPNGCAAVDLGCGPHGWLGLLSRWVGPSGRVVGTDTDPRALASARLSAADGRLGNVEVLDDDLFHSKLPSGSFDLVHSRFMLAPLGQRSRQVDIYLDLLKPGGWLFLEEPDTASWRYDPAAPAAEQLISLIRQVFAQQGGDLDAGTDLSTLCGDRVDDVALSATTLTLPPGHPYQQAPLHFAASLAAPLARIVGRRELADLKRGASREFAHPNRWGITFTLIQLRGIRRIATPGVSAAPSTHGTRGSAREERSRGGVDS